MYYTGSYSKSTYIYFPLKFMDDALLEWHGMTYINYGIDIHLPTLKKSFHNGYLARLSSHDDGSETSLSA